MSWIAWLVIALICLIIEAATVDFTFLMFAGGALLAMGVAFGTESLVIQVVVFAVVATLLLFVARPWAKKHINAQATTISNVYAQVGKPARTLTAVNADGGRVKIAGEEWSARTRGDFYEEGADLVVLDIDGVTAIVGKQ